MIALRCHITCDYQGFSNEDAIFEKLEHGYVVMLNGVNVSWTFNEPPGRDVVGKDRHVALVTTVIIRCINVAIHFMHEHACVFASRYPRWIGRYQATR